MSRLRTIVALLGASAVLLGAFGAHALPKLLVAFSVPATEFTQRATWWTTAAQYQLVHVLVTLIALTCTHTPRVRTAAAFLSGMLFFSGSLYLMAATGIRWLGAVTPIGGVLFIVGWLLLAHDFSAAHASANQTSR